MCVRVVSFTGSTCKMRCPVAAIQSIIVFRSPKSPMPKLPFVRSEKTGTNVPATLSSPSRKCTSGNS